MSYSKNFIFVKTQKTGSSSAEVVLSSLCDNNDYFTPMITYNNNVDDEKIRKQYTSISPKNFFNCVSIREHMAAQNIRRLDEKFYDKAFKFCIERHPYDKVISAINHKIHAFNIEHKEFKDVVDHIIKTKSVSDKNLYTNNNNEIIVDKIIQYSDLKIFIENFYFSKKQKKIILPKCKEYKKHIDINFLTLEQKIEIYNYFQFEFEYFNYDPMMDCLITY